MKRTHRSTSLGVLLGSIGQDIRFGLRTLSRRAVFTTVALLTLALGIGANTAVFSVIKGVLLDPLPFPDAHRLAMVWTRVPESGIERFSVCPVDFQDWRERNRSFDEIAVMENRRGTFAEGEYPERLAYTLVSPGFFRVLGVAPAMGRAFRDAENLRGAGDVAVLSHGFWQRALGGDPEVLGRSISLDGRSITIVGVMPTGFSFPGDEVQLWKPFGTAPDYSGRGTYTAMTIGRLRDGTDLAQAGADLDTIAAGLQQEYPNTNTGIETRIDPLYEIAVGSSRPVLLMLWGTVGLVLLIACANVANLLLTHESAREREVAIRSAMGAGRGRIVRQLLTESALLSTLGGGLGVFLAYWGIQWLPRLSASSIPRMSEVGIDRGVLLFALLLSALTGALFGILPALRSSRTDVSVALKKGGRHASGAPRPWLRRTLVVSELALALVVLVGAGLLGRSLGRVLQQDPGINPANLLTVRIEPKKHSEYQGQDPVDYRREVESELARVNLFYDDLLERAAALPGVGWVAAVSHKPLSGTHYFVRVGFHGRPSVSPDKSPTAQIRVVTPGYFRIMGVPLLSGRAPTRADAAGAQPVALVNETMARMHWPGESPVGGRITTTGDPGDWQTVVGVVGDVRQSMERDPDPLIYLTLPQGRRGFFRHWGMDIMLRTDGDPLALVGAVRGLVSSVDEELPVFGVGSMERIVANSTARRRFSVLLVGIFAGVALLLAGIGTYGVISSSVQQRSQEIGIRMALGAGRRDILRMILRQGILLTLAGVAAGVAVAVSLTRFMESLLFQITATDPATVIGVSALLAAVALIACYVPAQRATRVDPMDALRHE